MDPGEVRMILWYHLYWKREKRPRYVTSDLLQALRWGRGKGWTLHLEIRQ
jgi:rhamnogalacturonyl hydrolase YesR